MGGSGQQRRPAAPLVARWGRLSLGPVRAGAQASARVEVENAGSVVWRCDGPGRIAASYHWLDPLGNPLVWDGLRTPLPRAVEPGQALTLEVQLRGPLPPGRYQLALDLLDEGRLWFGEVGEAPPEHEVDVVPRIAARTLAVRIGPGPAELVDETERALAALDEPVAGHGGGAEAVAYLGAGCLPSADWSRRVLDAHAEGFAVVGGSVRPQPGLLERRRGAKALRPWAPGGGRNPAFAHSLLCPSLVRDTHPSWDPDVEGMPALRPPADEPWLYDGRIALTAPRRSGRPRA